MAISAATVFEVRTTGADTNGGGFVTGASGTDFSQQAAAQYSGSNLAATSATGASPSITSVSHNFVATDVGNIIQITAGTNWTTGFYQIVSVAANAATLDRACASVASPTSGTFAVGGALVSPGKACSGMVAGNTMWVKSGSYSVTSASTNVAAGCVSMPNALSTARCRMIGYTTSRGDGGRPTLTASGISTFTMIATGTGNYVEAIIIDGASLSSGRGFNGTSSTLYKCKAQNFTNNAFFGAQFILCEATGCTTQPAYSGGTGWFSNAYSNTGVVGFSGTACTNCISSNNSGAGGHGFSTTVTQQSVGCLAYGNGGDGFRFGTSTSSPTTMVNCIAVNNTGIGFDALASFDSMFMVNCAGFNNSGGNVVISNTSLSNYGFITLTANPFVNGAGNNFALNNVAGGGILLRGLATPASSVGLSTNNYADIGPVQSQDVSSIFEYRKKVR